ncbi:hypothetical protein VNO77_01994 [Canavalia gladiata]|uniref:Uncharacterized protein n=1 Tax=Canavalia gladiata TaxID=3824 RepID=A0AAN9MXF9_CANGL
MEVTHTMAIALSNGGDKSFLSGLLTDLHSKCKKHSLIGGLEEEKGESVCIDLRKILSSRKAIPNSTRSPSSTLINSLYKMEYVKSIGNVDIALEILSNVGVVLVGKKMVCTESARKRHDGCASSQRIK